MSRIIVAAALAVALPLGLASAAGPFDGQYTGGSPKTARVGGCPQSFATISVIDGKITGECKAAQFAFPITGTVAPDGTTTGKLGQIPFTGKFAGTHFTGSYDSKECKTPREINLDKAS